MFNKFILSLCLLLFALHSGKAQVYVNEVMSSNNTTIADEFGEFDDWIELYNSNVFSIDLRGKFITDDSTNPTKWEIPNTNGAVTTIPPQSYILLWADQDVTQGEHHLGFKLSSTGDGIFLYENDGVTLIDGFNFPGVATDQSYGRQPDGSSSFQVFSQPTPDASNNNATQTVAKPILVPDEGMYSGPQSVSITSSTPGASIYYTIDGSIPTTSSQLYTQPIAVDSTLSIRTMAIKPGFTNSFVETNSYIINFSSTYPVVYVTAEPSGLWDDQVGIYTIGTNGVAGYCTDTANFNQDFEVIAHADIYYPDGSQISDNNCGLKISGNCSRRNPQKPLALQFRNDYSDIGDNEVKHNIFEQKEIDEFKRLYLRKGNAAGITSFSIQYADPLANLVVEGEMDIETAGVKIVELFLNDEYWGMYDLREKFDQHRFVRQYKYATHKDSIDIIRNPGRDYPSTTWWAYQRATYGNEVDYNNFVNDFMARDLSIDTDYDAIVDQIQLDEMMNWLISGVFLCNRDWISNNVKVWKHGKHGKWRWCFVDFDHSMRIDLVDYDNLTGKVFYDWPNGGNFYSNQLYRKLFDNPRFRDEFIQRSATYMNTVFNNSRFYPIADSLKQVYKTHAQRAHNRWENDNSNSHYFSIGHPLAEIDSVFQTYFDFFAQRPIHIKNHYQTRWGINGMFTLNINTTAATNGKVAANNVYKELPINYTGEYFANVPFNIHAIPNAGYRFSHWQETGITDATIEVNTSLDLTLTPIFVPAQELVINEIHYHPTTSSNEEFIEIYNPDAQAKDLSNYELSSGICFKFPEGTSIAPGEYIVIAADATVYAGNGYQVFQWEYTNLSNGGENVGIANQIGGVLDNVSYDDNSPWNNQADGLGYSLALKTENLDNSVASNWHIQSGIFISPGAKNEFCTNFTASITPFPVSCYGQSTGSAIAFTNAGVGPFTYNWNNGGTTSAISNLTAGNYTLTVNDSFGCSYQSSTTITQPAAAITANVTATNDVICNGNNNGSISISPTGGTAPYNYNWSNGATSQNLTNVAGGNYTVNITDNFGCAFNLSASINEPTAMVLSDVHVDESIAGTNDGVINLAVSGGTSPYTYSWSNGATSQDISGLASGTYTVNVLDNNNCSATYSVVINPGVTACVMPSNISASNIQNTSATLSWSNDSNVNAYVVEYREQGTFNWNSFNSNFSFAILNNLLSCTTYEVRIKANCSSAQTSAYSNIYTFQTDGCVAPCATVYGLFSQNVTTSSAFLVWDIVPNASYTMYYRAVGNPSWFSYPTQFPIAILFTLPSCTDFEWYVEVNCPNGQVSTASPIANFTTVGAACKNDGNILIENSLDQEISKINVYPNPSINFINVDFESTTETNGLVKIYNTSGKEIYKSKHFINQSVNKIHINTEKLEKGNYILEILTNDQINIAQFIKM